MFSFIGLCATGRGAYMVFIFTNKTFNNNKYWLAYVSLKLKQHYISKLIHADT